MPTTEKLTQSLSTPSCAPDKHVQEGDYPFLETIPIDDEWDRLQQLLADFEAEQLALWEAGQVERYVY